jgi:gamma-glutamyltranspeptidase/glutathione hydrolase
MPKRLIPLCLGITMLMFYGVVQSQQVAEIVDLIPEKDSGIKSKNIVFAKQQMIASANYHISKAGNDMLELGGNAVDAAVASALMVTLVEPQSAGIGGGGFVLYYNQRQQLLTSIDGRETAASKAMPDLFLDEHGQPLSYPDAVNNGKSIGTPGLLRALEMLHKKYGKLPWATLFEPTIVLAEKGFAISPRLHELIQKDPFLLKNQATREYFYQKNGDAKSIGEILKNPQLAKTLKKIAQYGVKSFYEGQVARDIVSAVQQHPQPGQLNLNDLKNYQAIQRETVCGNYRLWKVCGMAPPSSGGVALIQILGILDQNAFYRLPPMSVPAIHYLSEAGRLAYADRDQYIADPAYTSVPVPQLIDKNYLMQRSRLIQENRSMKKATAGVLNPPLSNIGMDKNSELPSTSHISIVDHQGNAIAITLSVAAAFGSRVMVNGFLLNNEMTDFSFIPIDQGQHVLNQVAGGKRPRSSMSPTMVFDAQGKLTMVIGSAGGPAMINYVAKSLLGVLDWKMDMQQSINLPNIGSRNQETDIETGTLNNETLERLKSMGHSLKIWEMTSGTQGIFIDQNGLWGGVDPRREGVALGR